MDARIDVARALDVAIGDAHVLRNAGAIVTDDALRSLILSQRFLGTRRVVVMGHTDCGAHGLDDIGVAGELIAETGTAPSLGFGGFADLDSHVREQVRRVRACPWLPYTDDVSGCVYDVADASVRIVG
jgi:carbonic anhydrase